MSFDSFTANIKYLLIIAGLLSFSDVESQEVRLKNGSFEDIPRRGGFDFSGNRTSAPKGWFDCGAIQFPNHTPPDIHKGGTSFWENEIATHDGKTYLTMVVREDDSYESISQKLTGTLKGGKCYQFSIYLAQSPTYLSGTKRTGNEIKLNFKQPTVLRVWGGKVTCNQSQLLAESEAVDHEEWKEYKFVLEPNDDYQVITLEAFYKTPVLFGYNGHICLDNASHFRLVDCDQPEVLVAEVEKEEREKVIVPLHKRTKKRDTEVYVRPSKEANTDTVVFKKKKILDLNRSNMKLGLTIKLKKLHFDADKSDISVTSFDVLNEITEFLKQNPELTIEVGGHTNNNPPDYYCDSLSTVRAKSVADFITGSGIEDGRVTYKGYGKRHPIATNKTSRGRKTNQRVQIKITGLDYNMKEEEESGKG